MSASAVKLASAILRAEMDRRDDLEPLSSEVKDAAAEFLAHLMVAKAKFSQRGANMEKVEERARDIWAGIVGIGGTAETRMKAIDDLVLFVADSEMQVLA